MQIIKCPHCDTSLATLKIATGTVKPLTPDLAAFELANNIYRQPVAEVPAWELFNYDGTGYDFADYKTASGKDADSTYEEY